MKVIVNFFLILLSRLPFRVLYRLSSILSFIIHHIIRYRRKTVRYNLEIAFPNKTLKEKRKIEQEFYTNFADFLYELLKSFSMTKEDFAKRIKFANPELLKQEKDIILLSGHFFNWEWFTGLTPEFPQEKTYAVYKKVRNNYFDELVHESRAHFGTIPLSVNEVVRTMLKLENNGSHAFLFVADQSPFKTRIHYELDFFNRKTPAFNGYDRIARKKDYCIIYMDVSKISKGNYEVLLEKITPENEKFKENEIVEKFYQKLSKNILNQPDIWLWSHKRWKYTSGIDYQL